MQGSFKGSRGFPLRDLQGFLEVKGSTRVEGFWGFAVGFRVA